jgi:hypothetical protein
MKHIKVFAAMVLLGATSYCSPCQQQAQAQGSAEAQAKIPKGAKVFIAPMNGFEVPLKKAIADKKVPIEIVEQRELAQYEITGTSESKKAGAAKKIIMGSWHSNEDASIKVADLKSGEVVYAYSAHKQDSAHGQRSTAEACAKHLKDEAVVAK